MARPSDARHAVRCRCQVVCPGGGAAVARGSVPDRRTRRATITDAAPRGDRYARTWQPASPAQMATG